MSRTAAVLVLCASALVLTGCGRGLNPFSEKDSVLSGERRAVFGPDSGFEGPRKLPPPNSDYVGATMRADEPVPPAASTAVPPSAPGTGADPTELPPPPAQ